MLWSKPNIDKEKAAIRKRIDACPGGSREKLRYLLGEVKEHLETSHPKQQLSLFLLVVFTLAHHLRYGGLSLKDITGLERLGDTLLRLKGIESSRSRIGFLYGDLHMLLSQIYWKEGHQWDACWEQLLAKTQEGSGGKQSAGSVLALANRAFRLGQATNALAWFGKASELGLDGTWANQAALKRLMIYRLQQRYEEAELLEKAMLAGTHLTALEKREVIWERLSRQAQLDGDVAPLIHAVRKKGQHHEHEFACEAFLWSRTVSSTQWLKRFPKFRSLVYSSQVKSPKGDPLAATVAVIEQCYDSSVSILRRLRDLGELLGNTSQLINVNHELLFRAAAQRWLIRANARDARDLVRGEYESLCLKITAGATEDILGAFTEPALAKAA